MNLVWAYMYSKKAIVPSRTRNPGTPNTSMSNTIDPDPSTDGSVCWNFNFSCRRFALTLVLLETYNGSEGVFWEEALPFWGRNNGFFVYCDNYLPSKTRKAKMFSCPPMIKLWPRALSITPTISRGSIGVAAIKVYRHVISLTAVLTVLDSLGWNCRNRGKANSVCVCVFVWERGGFNSRCKH